MRPQLNGRAARAVAVAGAIVLAAGVSERIASAASSSPAVMAARSARHERRRSEPPRLQALLLHPNVLIGRDVALVGVVTPGGAPREVAVQARRGTRWISVARALTNRRGLFVERFWPRRLGRVLLRLRASGVSERRVLLRGSVATVYHEVIASWYGPGGVTACGEALGATTQGVANKTLPCGTMVTLRYRGRSVRVPVIDRGPYVAGRDYDLTYATRLALGAGGVSQIWASA
jgi:rare lipoprotein A